MIRRDQPLGAESPDRWLLVEQPEHARLSYELAAAWGRANVAPLACPPGASAAELLAVRGELLEAVRRHDDGWLGYADKPIVDESGRPLSFTEMPPDVAQPIWSASIEACRKIGPLAGWVAASHFHALQAKRDDDFPQWAEWLAGVDAKRSEWLGAWLGLSNLNSPELADRCLAWLQAFDWISLWLCCQCPVSQEDSAPEAALTVGGDDGPWPAVRFEPARTERGWELTVEPWPFTAPELRVGVAPRSVPVGPYDGSRAELTRLEWRLTQG